MWDDLKQVEKDQFCIVFWIICKKSNNIGSFLGRQMPFLYREKSILCALLCNPLIGEFNKHGPGATDSVAWELS